MPVGLSFWGKRGMRDSIFHEIAYATRSKKGNYTYSDWGFMLLQELVEHIEGIPLDSVAQREIYAPLGMQRTMYTPWKQGLAAECAPTENDLFFRKNIVQGYAHDMAAAMMGGIAGHAGLFSTATNLAAYGQMLLQEGEYGGNKLFSPETVRLFINTPAKANNNYRGYGFDKRNPKRPNSSYIGDSTSTASYGHIGFTGTILWIDPENDFVFVLLSNRTFPDSNNNTLNTLRIRSQIMNALLESIRHSTVPE